MILSYSSSFRTSVQYVHIVGIVKVRKEMGVGGLGGRQERVVCSMPVCHGCVVHQKLIFSDLLLVSGTFKNGLRDQFVSICESLQLKNS